ncbi:sigma-70 family RNA polymerase sigma factor [Arthrobacter sp. CDRTa11]|uniref:sigma-70 family RNA polymerase sigma factor n=1 Tax=Arthrobacter sp. CDRTa11 TaxID=2651199 RepID=UPI002265EB6B|nr:sigma-70 family RNA polymerase sigma factor [Arthrobacter sp. CDRTa11]UZX01660.1 sigma-70 family RNA polymerase sigma factor [Arthrobacter sp. CDRTa11]
MPDLIAALAVENTRAETRPVEVPPPNSPVRGGRLRQTFENDLVLSYLDLAEALAARFEARGRERADLNQVAYLGLVKAARGFDQTKGDSFPAYAAPTITGELKRYLRDRSWVVRPPRHIQDLRSRLFRVEPELAQTLGRNPTVDELAQELGVESGEVQEAISASSSLHPDSLDAVNPNSDAPPIAEVLAAPETPLERLEELACLREAMEELDPGDRELLYRRYFCEETQVELGKRLGMSQMQVSRRLARVLVELQRRLLENSYVAESRTGEALHLSAAPRRAGSGRPSNGSQRGSRSRVSTR